MNDKERVIGRLEGHHKYLWCPKCKCFPDKVIEKNILWEARVWDEESDCYIIDDNGRQDEHVEWTRCAKCDTNWRKNEQDRYLE